MSCPYWLWARHVVPLLDRFVVSSSPPVKEGPNSDLYEYDVESIIGNTYVDGRFFMLVKWVGYDGPTYEGVENLSCTETIAEYWATTGSSDGKFFWCNLLYLY